MPEYKITCKRTETLPGSPECPGWVKELNFYYTADTKACAIDAFLHDLYRKAKIDGYTIHYRVAGKEVVFRGDMNVMNDPQLSFIKLIKFESLKAVELCE